MTEIDRLQHIYQKAYFKKREYKNQVKEKNIELNKQAENFNKEIMFLRKKVRYKAQKQFTGFITFYKYTLKLKFNYFYLTNYTIILVKNIYFYFNFN